jgi:phosphate transport system permease protein
VRLEDGDVIKRIALAREGRRLTALAPAGTGERAIALGYDDGSLQIVRPDYVYSLREEGRSVSPALDYPRGTAALAAAGGLAITTLALGRDTEIVALQMADGELALVRFAEAAPGLDTPLPVQVSLGKQPRAAALHFLDQSRWLALLTPDGRYLLWSLAGNKHLLVGEGQLFDPGVGLTASAHLQGGMSLIAASSGADLVRYFVLGHKADGVLVPVQEFDTSGAVITHLSPEHRRRGFLAFSSNDVQWFNATAGERSLRMPLQSGADTVAAVSPRADRLLSLDNRGQLRSWKLSNPHPEVSLATLWRKVWYEGYQEPDWVYQSSASGNDYESKFSMTPLVFGTLKAAFYAMLFAMPIAIGGAVYTAFFMAPALRRRIKPLVELMEALPTVILGFLAGLWLAPLVENGLSEMLTMLLVLPPGVLLFGFAWSRLPARWRGLVPDGWHAVLLLPVIPVICWLGLLLGAPLEAIFFDGDARVWLSQELGLAYDQRNAMVVGIAMGLAVIPTIFSIAEDAIYSVPRNLSYGSLALGATPWQTLAGVVLPTASPGVFSALMIGFGRAVGETMIVLMATGNTPIMDLNVFEGMRTLAANIAVEAPEAQVSSTHYRILFLAAFILFVFTFCVNTAAEVVRQRLRARYGALG